MKRQGILIAIFAVTVAFFGAGNMNASGAPVSQAKVLEIMGEAQYRLASESDWKKLETGLILHEGDVVKTGKDSEVKMELVGAAKTAEIMVRKDTELVFETFRHDGSSKEDETLLNVDIGAVLVKAEKLVGDSKFEVKTPTSIVGIRGTTFEVYASKE